MTGQATGYTAEYMEELLGESIIGGHLDEDGHLQLERRNGEEVDSGYALVAGHALSAFPVGALYFDTVDRDPSTVLGGGTWARYGEGRTLISQTDADPDFDTAGETGGGKTATIAVENLPHQTGSLGFHGGEHGSNMATPSGVFEESVVHLNEYRTIDNYIEGTNSLSSVVYDNDGEDEPLNIMNPYIVTFIWRRTA